jgi:hypothetical protein
MKDGRCDLLHPGVKAPGKPKIATFLPAHSSARFTSTGPSAPVTSSFMTTEGIASPTLTTVIVDESPATDEAREVVGVVRNVFPVALNPLATEHAAKRVAIKVNAREFIMFSSN